MSENKARPPKALVGLMLVIVAPILLVANERESFRRIKALKVGQSVVVSAGAAEIDPANEGALIHVQGEGRAKADPADSDFGITGSAALVVERKAEMYQWKEEEVEVKEGDGSTHSEYRYEGVWSDEVIDSGFFAPGHDNPSTFDHDSNRFYASEPELGAFQLTEEVLDAVRGLEPRPVTPAEAAAAQARERDGTLYVADPDHPVIGDERYRFRVLPAGPLTVVGAQDGSSFGPFPTPTGDVLLAAKGSRNSAEMFKIARHENRVQTWGGRLAGTMALWMGLAALFAPLSRLVRSIPGIGGTVGGALEGAVALGSAIVALVVSTAVIAVAWLFYRPVVGIILLSVVVLGGLGAVALSGRRQGEAEQEAQPSSA